MIEPMIPAGTRAVFFDAVGTLIDPDPPVVEVYLQAGRRHGIELAPSEIAARFHTAFLEHEREDAAVFGLAVSEEHERRRWSRIVGHVFGDAATTGTLFDELWEHFAKPWAWRVLDGVGETLGELQRRGLKLGLASNFDGRLHGLADALPDLMPLTRRLISSEIGWRKPSPRFFAAVVQAAGCEPGAIVFVGDRRDADFDGARAAGLQALLLDPSPGPRHIARLRQLVEDRSADG